MRGKACREREARLSQEKLLGLLIYDPETGVSRVRGEFARLDASALTSKH